MNISNDPEVMYEKNHHSFMIKKKKIQKTKNIEELLQHENGILENLEPMSN